MKIPQPKDPKKKSELRRRLKGKLLTPPSPRDTLKSLRNARRLILELQTHQIELQTQNEALENAQQALARERKKYEELYQFAPLPYFSLDERDLIIDVNLAGAELLGAKRASLVNRPLSPYLTPESLETFIASRQAALESGRMQTCELLLRTRARKKVYVQAHTVALPAEADSPQLWRVVMADVTEKKLPEEALRESEERFRALADSMSDVVYTLDAEQRYTGVFGDWALRAGLTPEFFLGKTAREILGGEAAPVHEEANRRALAGEKVLYEWATASAYYQTSVSPLRNSRGEVVGVVGVGRDITALKRMESALRQSEERYRSLFDNMTEGFALHELVFDERGEPCDYRFLEINRAFEQLTGLKREHVIGKTQREVLPQEDRFWFETYKKVTLTGESVRVEHYAPTLGRHYEVYAYSPAQNQFAVIFSDITGRKQAEENMRELNAVLERRVEERTRELLDAQEKLVRQEKLAALGQMAGGVGHELRNPLSVISNAVYFLKMAQPEAGEKIKEYLDLMGRQTDIANKIIADLLDFTRVKSLERGAVSIPDVVRQTLGSIPGCDSANVRFEAPEELPPVYADSQHVRQILVNLILNACQAMVPRGGEIVVRARVDSSGDMLALSVCDSGPGIPPEHMPKLFEPLFTTKPRGIGLGLPVCRNLAEANSGRIEVESQLGAGSVFTLYLPVFRSES